MCDWARCRSAQTCAKMSNSESVTQCRRIATAKAMPRQCENVGLEPKKTGFSSFEDCRSKSLSTASRRRGKKDAMSSIGLRRRREQKDAMSSIGLRSPSAAKPRLNFSCGRIRSAERCLQSQTLRIQTECMLATWRPSTPVCVMTVQSKPCRALAVQSAGEPRM
jgi:hypothetical protein